MFQHMSMHWNELLVVFFYNILMNKQYYLDNWDNYWQSYNKLNPDLANNGIHSKRALFNHYNARGYIENRLVTIANATTHVENNATHVEKDIPIATTLLLSFEMFKEKI